MLEIVGAVLAVALTVNTKLSLAVRLPSLTVTVMVAVPVWLRAGVTLMVRLAPEPPKTMFAAGTKVGLEDAPETIRLPAAVCESPTVKAIGAVAVFWLVDRSAMLEIVGAVFAVALTVSTKLSLAVKLPSLTVTVMVAVPVWLRAGVTVTVRLAPEPPKTMLAAGTKVGLEEAPETIRLPATVCASPTVKAIGAVAVFWLVDRSAMLEIVGAVFAVALTVSTKLSLAVRLPSLTVTVMVAVPVWLRAGVTVTVRLAPEPPKTMLATGTKVGLEEAPERVRLPAAVCESPTVRAIGAVAVFWLVDR